MAGVISVVSLVLGLLLLVSSVTSSSSSSLSCRDEDGNQVDWWILYKLPKRKEEGNFSLKHKNNKHKHHKHKKNHRHKHKSKQFEAYINEGVAYAYLTSSMPDNEWTLSEYSINDERSMPGKTLKELYDQNNNPNLFSLMYNDEHPNGPTSFTKGHTKGLVYGDQTNSLWMIHSVPHYPPYPNRTYSYPPTGHTYGQTALCLSLGSEQLDVIGKQLTYNDPYIYHTSLPGWLDQYNHMVKAAHGYHIKKAPYYNTEVINTLGGLAVTVFAKYTLFDKDLYADLVAPMLQTPLLTETWPNGGGRMPSYCTGPYIVENVDEMDFEEIEDDDFTTTKDHSKWAISLDKKKPFVCIGDINRMESQKKRAGGTACFILPTVWKTFKRSVKDIESC